MPAVGSTSRLMQRMTVDLPAPDGPISAITCAVGHVEVDALEREIAGAVALGQTLDPQHRLPPAMRLHYLQVYFTPLACVDLANDAPVFLVGDRDELVLGP